MSIEFNDGQPLQREPAPARTLDLFPCQDRSRKLPLARLSTVPREPRGKEWVDAESSSERPVIPKGVNPRSNVTLILAAGCAQVQQRIKISELFFGGITKKINVL